LYCGRACSRLARRCSLRQAARRYQDSHRGRTAHARRTQAWRQRAAARAEQAEAQQAQDVTHQGCRLRHDAAPLAPCTDQTPGNTPDDTPDDTTNPSTVTPPPPGVTPRQRCRRCATPLAGWLRHGFVRHAAARWRHDHLP